MTMTNYAGMEASASAHLALRHVSVTYSTPAGGVVTAVDDADLEIGRAEFVCIVGPSGCGKTTLLRVAAGLHAPTAGVAVLNGDPITGPGRERCMVFQEYALFPWYNALDNVAYGLKLMGLRKSERRERAHMLLGRVGLDKYARHYPAELSGGMRQRVAIARALAVDPEVLLMDEPFGALDAQTRGELQVELLKVWEMSRKTTLFITHSIEEAVYLADRVVVMAKDGRIVKEFWIQLPRPRDKRSEEFNHYEAEISGLFAFAGVGSSE